MIAPQFHLCTPPAPHAAGSQSPPPGETQRPPECSAARRFEEIALRTRGES